MGFAFPWTALRQNHANVSVPTRRRCLGTAISVWRALITQHRSVGGPGQPVKRCQLCDVPPLQATGRRLRPSPAHRPDIDGDGDGGGGGGVCNFLVLFSRVNFDRTFPFDSASRRYCATYRPRRAHTVSSVDSAAVRRRYVTRTRIPHFACTMDNGRWTDRPTDRHITQDIAPFDTEHAYMPDLPSLDISSEQACERPVPLWVRVSFDPIRFESASQVQQSHQSAREPGSNKHN